MGGSRHVKSRSPTVIIYAMSEEQTNILPSALRTQIVAARFLIAGLLGEIQAKEVSLVR
jgi:hypothetical protein